MSVFYWLVAATWVILAWQRRQDVRRGEGEAMETTCTTSLLPNVYKTASATKTGVGRGYGPDGALVNIPFMMGTMAFCIAIMLDCEVERVCSCSGERNAAACWRTFWLICSCCCMV